MKKPDFDTSITGKNEKGRWIIAAALICILSTFGISATQAQVIIDENFTLKESIQAHPVKTETDSKFVLGPKIELPAEKRPDYIKFNSALYKATLFKNNIFPRDILLKFRFT